MKKLSIISLLLTVITISAYSQMTYNLETGKITQVDKKSFGLAVEIKMKNGEVLKGNCKLPRVASKTLAFEHLSNGEETTLNAEEIDTLKVINNNGGYSKLVYSKVYKYKPKKGMAMDVSKKDTSEIMLKEYKKPIWILMLMEGKANLYVSGMAFGVDEEGNVYASLSNTTTFSGGHISSMTLECFHYFGQMAHRNGEIVFITETIVKHPDKITPQLYLYNAPVFFFGHPLAEKIKNKEKEYKKDIVKAFEEYNEK